MFGHDVGRTAATPGGANITKPVTRWRQYLGGSIGKNGVRAADVDGDGVRDLLIDSGGRVTARHDDDVVVWQSPLIEIVNIVDLLDFDGDGQLDVLVRATDRVLLLAGRTGAIEWDSLDWKGTGYPLGSVGAVRIADLDGDGHEDLYVAAAWCGAASNADDRGAIAWSFRGDGSLDHPKKLFETRHSLPETRCGYDDLLADVDGDGKLEAVSFSTSRVHAFSTRDGSLKFSSDDVGSFPYSLGGADVADLNGDGKQDLVLYTDNRYNPMINSRRVLVVGWHLDATGHSVFGKWWEHGVADLANDRHGYADSSLRDVDGDGKLEVTTSFYSSQDKQWTLEVYDAKTGAEKARLTDSGQLLGLANFDQQGTVGVITDDGADGLRAFAFAGGSLNELWTYSHTRLITVPDPMVARLHGAAGRVLVADACADANPELILFELDASLNPATVAAYQTGLDVGAARCPNAYDVRQVGEAFIGGFPLDGGKSLAVARSSGFLTALAFRDGVIPTNLGPTGTYAGVHLGGYYSGPSGRGDIPIAPSLGNGLGTPVVTRDSRGFLSALDVSKATLVAPPVVRWSRADTGQPSAFSFGGAAPLILGWHKNAIIEFDAATGLDVHKFQIAPPRSPTKTSHFDVLATDLNGDGTPDLIYQIFDAGSGNTITGTLNTLDGTPVWPMSFDYVSAGCGEMSTSLGDLNQDGVLDVVTGACSKVAALDGKTGGMLPGGPAEAGYAFAALVADVDGDGKPEILTSGQYKAPRAFRRDLSSYWMNTDVPNPSMFYHFAALARCPKGERYATTDEALPAFYVLDATTGTTLNGMTGSVGVFLAGGAVYPSIDAVRAAGKHTGRLGNVTTAQSLRGADTPTFLVGSTDGFLYAIDACSSALAWSLDLGSPVGQPIVADVRNTGQEEIVVSVADGYLYGVDQELFPAPASVRDVDPLHGHPNDQVRTIATIDTLYVAWDPVRGAQKYECAVLNAVGKVITTPDFVDCGTGTSASIPGLPLQPGATYQQAVRAVGATGTSTEALSKGVQVVGTAVDGGAADSSIVPPPLGDRGCSCQVGATRSPAPSAAWALLACLAALALHRRRP